MIKKATIVADSLNQFGNRITTMICTLPRYILAELNTHRMFSRNSASSRAIPFRKLLQSVEENPFIPIAWMKDHKGMQGTEYFNEEESKELNKIWLKARDSAISYVKLLGENNVTKQLINRQIEAYMYHTVIITATEWENFFHLRCPQYEVYAGPTDTEEYRCFGRSWKDFMKSNGGLAKDWETDNIVERLKLNKGQADIHMMALAEDMWDAYNESIPVKLNAGEWHIPFNEKLDIQTEKVVYGPLARIKVATAMCARVSYTVIGEEGKEPNFENDIKLHDRLAASGHWSPFEHCAQAMNESEYALGFNPGWSGNFHGFNQYRKTFQNENYDNRTQR